MSKRTRVVGTYRIDESELLQFAVTFAADAYPDVLAEAKASVLAMLHDGLADVLAQTRPAEQASE
jgi:hypothetical protein